MRESWEQSLLDPRPRPRGDTAAFWLSVLAADLRLRDRSLACWTEDVKHRLGLVTMRSDERKS